MALTNQQVCVFLDPPMCIKKLLGRGHEPLRLFESQCNCTRSNGEDAPHVTFWYVNRLQRVAIAVYSHKQVDEICPHERESFITLNKALDAEFIRIQEIVSPLYNDELRIAHQVFGQMLLTNICSLMDLEDEPKWFKKYEEAVSL